MLIGDAGLPVQRMKQILRQPPTKPPTKVGIKHPCATHGSEAAQLARPDNSGSGMESPSPQPQPAMAAASWDELARPQRDAAAKLGLSAAIWATFAPVRLQSWQRAGRELADQTGVDHLFGALQVIEWQELTKQERAWAKTAGFRAEHWDGKMAAAPRMLGTPRPPAKSQMWGAMLQVRPLPSARVSTAFPLPFLDLSLTFHCLALPARCLFTASPSLLTAFRLRFHSISSRRLMDSRVVMWCCRRRGTPRHVSDGTVGVGTQVMIGGLPRQRLPGVYVRSPCRRRRPLPLLLLPSHTPPTGL